MASSFSRLSFTSRLEDVLSLTLAWGEGFHKTGLFELFPGRILNSKFWEARTSNLNVGNVTEIFP